MVNEPRRSGRALRAFALALISCLALAAASASTASAISIEPEAIESPEFPAEFSISGGGFYAETFQRTVSCSGKTTGSGAFENDSHGTVTLELHGCTTPYISKANCTSSGAETGTIVTSTLSVDLVELPGEAGAGIVLDPLGTDKFAEFVCIGNLVPVVWEGGVIGEITDPGYGEPSSVWSVAFDATGDSQDFTETAGGWKSHLVQSWNGGENQDAGVNAGVDLEFEEGQPGLSPEEGEPFFGLFPAGGFPASVTYSSYWTITLSVGETTVKCTQDFEKEEFASGSGEFSDMNTGEAQLTLINCREAAFNSYCTTSGESAGTIKTESLPVEVTPLSDSNPGLSLSENESSGLVAKFKCLGGFVTLEVSGGVLGEITSPGVFESSWLQSEMNVVEGQQEYTETEGSETVELQGTINGGAAKAATLDMTLFGGGSAELRERVN